MQVERSGAVFAGAPGSGVQSATFPVPCVNAEGRWFCIFRGAPQKLSNADQRVLLTWSDDQGRNWEEPAAPFAPPAVEGRPGLLRFGGITDLGEGRLLAALSWVDYSDPGKAYFNERTEGLLDTRIFLSVSEDNGAAWSPLRLVDTAPFNVPAPLTGPVLRLPTGDLACQFELNKHYEDPEPWRHGSVLIFSSDGGRSWPRHVVVTRDPANRIFYWDQRPSVLPDGRLLDVFWTFDRVPAAYLNIHAIESSDGGRTWSSPRDTGVSGQPGPIFPLVDGSLAMPVVDRRAAPAIRIRRSVDGGKTWPEEDQLSVYESEGPEQTQDKSSMQDAWAEMYRFSVGLPNVAQLPGGGGLLTYYAGSETDVTSIRWALVRYP